MNDYKKKDCEPPFWKNISIIFDNFSLQYKPECEHSPWNFVIRLLLISLFVGMIASVFGGLSVFVVTLMFGLITALMIIFTQKESKSPKKDTRKSDDTYHTLPYKTNVNPSGYLAPLGGAEGFINGGSTPGSVQPSPSGVVEVDAFPYYGPMLPAHTQPVARNLFMNVLLDEIKYNPGRPVAESVTNPTVKQTMDDYFRVQWFSDPTDVFGVNQSQRQFITQPSTSVPNDQGSFADWLYKIPGKTCKEGGREACLSGTDGGALVWSNHSS